MSVEAIESSEAPLSLRQFAEVIMEQALRREGNPFDLVFALASVVCDALEDDDHSAP